LLFEKYGGDSMIYLDAEEDYIEYH